MQGTVKTVKMLNCDAFAAQGLSAASRSSFLPDGMVIASAKVFSNGKQIGDLFPKCFSTDKVIANKVCKLLYEKRTELTLDLSNGARLVRKGANKMLQAEVYVEEPKMTIALGGRAGACVDQTKLLLVPETTATLMRLEESELVSVWTNPIFRKCTDANTKDLVNIESLLRDPSKVDGLDFF